MKQNSKKISVEKKTPIEKKSKDSSIKVTDDFPVVGIGASAGGLEALEQFFNHMPENCGMAFVIIQHLDPNHVGIMPELLQRMTLMKVFQSSDRLKIKPNCIYVIPPNKSLTILNGYLYLFDPIESRGLRLPIDIFFRSLAEDKQEKAIGIILSGMGSDGSLGLKAIKEKNGVVLVQEPESAKFDGMPRAATEAVMADIVAPAQELPAKLISYLKFLPVVKPDVEIESKNKSNLEKIIILIRESSGHDFSLYKKNTLFRRVERRKGIHQIDKIQNYVKFLQENPKEIEILFKELLIGVTSFFRDSAVWDCLRDKILPDLINEMPNGHIFRAWVAGCSTGEEAYSLAIILKEVTEKFKKNKNITFQIFATDLDFDAVEKARKGIYPKNISNDVSPERLSRFFIDEGDGYRINNTIREMVIFATQNIIKDPPFTKLDFLSCRNMLIYMEPELQNKLISLFNYGLNTGGILLLGTSESLGNEASGFNQLDSKLKIFNRTSKGLQTELLDFPSSFFKKTTKVEEKIQPKAVDNIQSTIEQIIIQQFAPPSVLVNESGDIIYITGRTGKYLEPVAGKANWNIHAMAREGLLQVLPGALRMAAQSYEKVIIPNIKIEINGRLQYLDLIVQQLENPTSVGGKFIIVFSDVPDKVNHYLSSKKTGKLASGLKQKELEEKLQRSYEDMRIIREEMQTSQEELKSTNEELQSTNEELQSTNEELTTSKEEMQSLNEELQTINIELQSKVNDFIRTNDDMKNLLNSTEIATLFVDKDLNIRRFTDQVAKIFKIREGDIGRPFTDLVSFLNYPDISSHAEQVLKSLITIENSIPTTDDKWFNIRIMPYRTLDDRIDGLVITFSDISESKKLEAELSKSIEILKDYNLLNAKKSSK